MKKSILSLTLVLCVIIGCVTIITLNKNARPSKEMFVSQLRKGMRGNEVREIFGEPDLEWPYDFLVYGYYLNDGTIAELNFFGGPEGVHGVTILAKGSTFSNQTVIEIIELKD